MAGLALSLSLEESYFADRYTGEPLTLFRIFNYPPPRDPDLWGVGEHTDYGLLTILGQDDAGSKPSNLSASVQTSEPARVYCKNSRRLRVCMVARFLEYGSFSAAKPETILSLPAPQNQRETGRGLRQSRSPRQTGIVLE